MPAAATAVPNSQDPVTKSDPDFDSGVNDSTDDSADDSANNSQDPFTKSDPDFDSGANDSADDSGPYRVRG